MVKTCESEITSKVAPVPKLMKGSPEFFKLIGRKEEEKGPLYVTMNLETGCGYRCIKCALPGHRENMGTHLSFEQRKKFLAQVGEIGVKTLVIIGRGEPTENFGDLIRPVINAAHREGLITIMFTTASHLNEEQAEFYCDNNVSVFVSLDSLDPNTYRELTGCGNIGQVLKNIGILRSTYSQAQEIVKGKNIVRLGINVTVSKQNRDELSAIKAFAGDDMQFIANPTIRRGKAAKVGAWEKLVGSKYEELKKLAQGESETGGHSSIDEGVCSYFHRGISVDCDGMLLSCGYASETAPFLGGIIEGITAKDITTPERLMRHYHEMRAKYIEFTDEIRTVPSCPLRDNYYQRFLDKIKEDKD